MQTESMNTATITSGKVCRAGRHSTQSSRCAVIDTDWNASTQMNATMRKQLERYMPQLQLYLEISGVKAMYFANIFGNSRYEYVKVAKDDQYLEQMFVHLKEFWGYVERKEEPPQSMPHFSASIDHIPINDMVARDASTTTILRFGRLNTSAQWTQPKNMRQPRKT